MLFDPNEGVAYVPIPMTLLPEVFRFVADRTDPGGAAEVTDFGANPLPGGTMAAAADKAPWTGDELAQIARGTTESTRLVTQVMDVLVERPGEYFSTTDLVARLGVVRNNLRGALSALTRHINKHYPDHLWPFRAVWGAELGEGFNPAEMYYVIDPGPAATWNAARGA